MDTQLTSSFSLSLRLKVDRQAWTGDLLPENFDNYCTTWVEENSPPSLGRQLNESPARGRPHSQLPPDICPFFSYVTVALRATDCCPSGCSPAARFGPLAGPFLGRSPPSSRLLLILDGYNWLQTNV
ncbi:hypothetical protein R1flu_019439 [Riccia fluitans]|uniref:Uncharacterized protein n=1 Tax=Riccia fluitans TaxID=41844 RepID=A0ABD1ZK78_9MARC